MQEIKPIETRYNGLRFRSRLEARWAVFFDELNIKYLYEHEGYDMGTIGKYLPDFFLPDLDLFVEVKPEHAVNQDVINKIYNLQHPGIILGEIPHVPEGCDDFWWYDKSCKHDGWEWNGVDYPWVFCICQECGAVGFQFDGRSDRLKCKESYDNDGNGCKRSRHGDKGYSGGDYRILAAYDKARSCRFEHGENGE